MLDGLLVDLDPDADLFGNREHPLRQLKGILQQIRGHGIFSRIPFQKYRTLKEHPGLVIGDRGHQLHNRRQSQDGPKHVGLEIDLKGLGHHFKRMPQTTTKDRPYRISSLIPDQDRLFHVILSHSVGIQFYP